MNIEFHYHITFLIAARAGFPPEDAQIIATASQTVDDNSIIFEIDKERPTAYRNYISQTMNILKPKAKLFRIYPIFHFVPGDPMAETAWRKDGQMHWLNTTPDSQNARRILDTALETDNLCRIGIGLHGYADTWAHQNFTGYYNDFNAMTGPLNPGIFSIGHAEAFHNPDWAALVWKDKRLINSRIDNKTRFLDAARHMLTTLATHTDPQMPQNELQKRETELTADLDRAIGTKDPSNDFSKQRITRYEELAQRKPYGQEAMKPYDPDDWMDQAVNEDVRGLRDRSDFSLSRWDPLTDIYTWKNPDNCTNTHWYRFQEAVKQHQSDTLAILMETNLKGLELPEM